MVVPLIFIAIPIHNKSDCVAEQSEAEEEALNDEDEEDFTEEERRKLAEAKAMVQVAIRVGVSNCQLS